MRQEQKDRAARIAEKIREKGVTGLFVASRTGVKNTMLSAVLSGKQKYVSDTVLDKIENFVDQINTLEIEV